MTTESSKTIDFFDLVASVHFATLLERKEHRWKQRCMIGGVVVRDCLTLLKIVQISEKKQQQQQQQTNQNKNETATVITQPLLTRQTRQRVDGDGEGFYLLKIEA